MQKEKLTAFHLGGGTLKYHIIGIETQGFNWNVIYMRLADAFLFISHLLHMEAKRFYIGMFVP